ncbi:MAG: peptidoglycan editing factor PgeF [Lachnospiraceae bacterium]|nr:peptidoglycan editing factor PgeF [Lachnospiraceae bacterium]
MIDVTKAKRRIDEIQEKVNKPSERAVLVTEREVPFVVSRGMEAEGIKYGFSTRLGGVSKGIYESMNLGLKLSDERENVIENYRRFSKALEIDFRKISCPDQLHNANVSVVTGEHAGCGIINELKNHNADAQITNVRGIPLIVYSADCVPILLADPVKGAIGSIHAGWRGTVAEIAALTVMKMQEVYGCDPGNIRAVIGPSIGPDNYEVDDKVINELKKCKYIDLTDCEDVTGPVVRQEEGEKIYTLYRTVKEKNKYMLDLWSINELILYKAGLKTDNIHNMKLCTMDNPDIFFSHRFTGGKRGLNAGIISLT